MCFIRKLIFFRAIAYSKFEMKFLFAVTMTLAELLISVHNHEDMGKMIADNEDLWDICVTPFVWPTNDGQGSESNPSWATISSTSTEESEVIDCGYLYELAAEDDNLVGTQAVVVATVAMLKDGGKLKLY
eukprot:GHVP01062204.1.p1 GENE.GHVP01062204.1~~GHVP01062204.1.p1  ORF type:complete len:130 (+),score=25.04 GHVP01062204.1:22-411(+)